MAAIWKQIWSISDTVTIIPDPVSAGYAFWLARDPAITAKITAHVSDEISAGRTLNDNLLMLVDRDSRKLCRVREFVDLASAQNNVDWYTANTETQVLDTAGNVIYSLISHEAVDNMDLAQIQQKWPNI